MKLFLDSSAVIEFFRSNGDVVAAVTEANEVYTSAICAYEVLLGEAYKAAGGRRSSLDKVQKFFNVIGTMAFTYDDAVNASRIMAGLSARGKRVDEFDALIASQALALDATVLTKDAKHFGVLEEESGLSVQTIR